MNKRKIINNLNRAIDILSAKNLLTLEKNAKEDDNTQWLVSLMADHILVESLLIEIIEEIEKCEQ